MERDKRTLVELFNIPGATVVFEEFYKKEVYLNGGNYISHQPLIDCLQKVGTWLENPDKTVGLMMAGNTGNGKSTALKTIGRLIICSRQFDSRNLDAFGYPKAAFLRTLKAIEVQHYVTNEYEFNRLKRSTLLAIDDFGTENLEVMSYGNTYSPIIELLEYRYDNRLFTILTTNMLNKTIRERYGDRMADRFNEMMTCVAFPDITFRIKT